MKIPSAIHAWLDTWKANVYLLAPCDGEQLNAWMARRFRVPDDGDRKAFAGRAVLVRLRRLMKRLGAPLARRRK